VFSYERGTPVRYLGLDHGEVFETLDAQLEERLLHALQVMLLEPFLQFRRDFELRRRYF